MGIIWVMGLFMSRLCTMEKVKESEVAQLCPTLLDPMDCSLPCSSILGIFQARVLEWVAIFFSRGSSQPRDWNQVSCIAGRLYPLSHQRIPDGKESACNTGDSGLIPGLGRSPGKGHGNPLQYSCLENPMDRGAWRATVHGVTKSQTWLSS